MAIKIYNFDLFSYPYYIDALLYKRIHYNPAINIYTQRFNNSNMFVNRFVTNFNDVSRLYNNTTINKVIPLFKDELKVTVINNLEISISTGALLIDGYFAINDEEIILSNPLGTNQAFLIARINLNDVNKISFEIRQNNNVNVSDLTQGGTVSELRIGVINFNNLTFTRDYNPQANYYPFHNNVKYDIWNLERNDRSVRQNFYGSQPSLSSNQVVSGFNFNTASELRVLSGINWGTPRFITNPNRVMQRINNNFSVFAIINDQTQTGKIIPSRNNNLNLLTDDDNKAFIKVTGLIEVVINAGPGVSQLPFDNIISLGINHHFLGDFGLVNIRTGSSSSTVINGNVIQEDIFKIVQINDLNLGNSVMFKTEDLTIRRNTPQAISGTGIMLTKLQLNFETINNF